MCSLVLVMSTSYYRLWLWVFVMYCYVLLLCVVMYCCYVLLLGIVVMYCCYVLLYIVVMYCCYVLLLCVVVMYCCYVLLVVAIDTVLLFRPLKITTADFGKKWGTLAYEKKLKLSSSTSITVAQHFMDTMSSKFNFYPVEIIGIA